MNQSRRPVFVSGAAAVSAFGFEWRGIGAALKEGRVSFSHSSQLADSHPSILASEVPAIPVSIDAANAKAQKLMSRAAHLATIAVQQALADAHWEDNREEIGFYAGVGASGGSMVELTEMLRASIVEHQFSLARFGSAGLAACNPLFAFQLMNNFTLCHGAILAGVSGPNSAFYSRGNGTVAALFEASHAIAEGDCERALAGGADSAVHAVTWAELKREGYARNGFVPGEGAALLALSASADNALAIVEHCAFGNSLTSDRNDLDKLLMNIDITEIHSVIIAPWGTPARQTLRALTETHFPQASVLNINEFLGDALAATPALAWVTALDLLQTEEINKCLILNAGIDGGIGAVLLGKTSRHANIMEHGQ
ncbi:MAG: beta-ketoacyl synthase N-terminal-like domain-containing protein [Pseudomonadota bacterium]